MRAEMAYETCVDVSTCNGLGSFLRHVSRRHEASRLPSPIAMVFAGTSGAVIQFATDGYGCGSRRTTPSSESPGTTCGPGIR
jgi:hypothetical protein